MDTACLDWALADVSGYVAADARYDGPFCMLSAVAHRGDQRILYDVLEHDPTHEDLRAVLGRLTTALAARDVTRVGLTTEGSPRSPEPRAEVCGGVPPHSCPLHVLKALTTGGWKGVAKERAR